MTKIELIASLIDVPDDTQIMILDGFNGGGSPREINLGPALRLITAREADETGDCEDLVGKLVIVFGFGCY